MAPEKDRALSGLGFLAAAAAAAFWIFRFRAARYPDSVTGQGYAHAGEILLHGIPRGDPLASTSMPLSTLWAAIVDNHLSLPPVTHSVWASAVVALLTVAVCRLLRPASRLTPAVSLVLLSASFSHDWLQYPQLPFTVLVVLSAGLLLPRSASPSLVNTMLAALALGATLLFRSTLCLLPPLLACHEAFSPPQGMRRGRWVHGAILCVVPYLFLIPWIAMNWAIHHRFLPFERSQSHTNVVSGALGMVQSIEGDWASLIDDPAVDPSDTGKVVRWAARQVLGHPVDYLHAFCRRIYLALSLHPFLAALALAGVWRFREQHAFRTLALLALYLLGAHCLMALDTRYLVPLWPLLSVLAAVWLSAAVEGGRRDAPNPGSSWVIMLRGALVLLLVLCVRAQGLVLAYGRDSRHGFSDAEQDWRRAWSRAPGDAWILRQAGQLRLDRGDLRGAEGWFSAAAALVPKDEDLALRLAWTRLLQGAPPSTWNLPSMTGRSIWKLQVMKAFHLSRAGRHQEARTQLLEARTTFQRLVMVQRRDAAPETRTLEKLLDRARGSFGEEVVGLIATNRALRTDDFLSDLESVSQGPGTLTRIARMYADQDSPGKAARAYERLLRSSPRDPGLWLSLAAVQMRSGRHGAAAESLGRAAGLASAGESLLRVPLMRVAPETRSRARAAFLKLVRASPGSPGLWLNLAAVQAGSGERKEALESLDKAAALDPAPASLRQIARVFVEWEEYDLASEVFGKLRGSFPRDPGLWLSLAELQNRSGGTEAALESVRTAVRLDPSAAERHQAALLYQQLGRYADAIDMIEGLIREQPAVPAFFVDRGISQYLSGSTREAEASFAQARRLDPKFLPACLSLGIMLEREGRLGEAAKVYAEASPVGARAPGSRLFETILSRRKALALRKRRPSAD